MGENLNPNVKSGPAEDSLTHLVHELRSPLLVFEFGLSALEERLRDEEDLDTLRMMRRQLEQATYLLEDATALSALAPGRLRLSKKHDSLRQLLREVYADFLPQFDAANILFKLDVPIEIQLNYDQRRLTQALHNLLTNALRYTPSQGEVCLRGRIDEHSAFIDVIDNGRGLCAEQLRHVFAPFYRADRSAEPAGLGVGLSIVQRIIAAHAGSVSVASPGLGQGCHFTLQLPLREGGNEKAP